MMNSPTSLTWTAHLKLLFIQYNLPDPLALLQSPVWSKESWKALIKSSVTNYHETIWRRKAEDNSKLKFLNIQVSGLSGRPHPTLASIISTQQVTVARTHIKMLAGDYPCSAYIGADRNKDRFCRLCRHYYPQHNPPTEDMVHLLVICRCTADTRAGILPELLNIISYHFPNNTILHNPNHTNLTQLLLDPTSLNLPLTARIAPNHPALPEVLHVCRKLCFAIHKSRTSLLKHLKTA